MTANDATPSKPVSQDRNWQTLIDFILSGEPGSASLATDLVVGTAQTLNWPAAHLEQLKLTLAKAIQNALERRHLTASGVSLIIRVFIPEGDEIIRTIWPGSDPGEDQVPAEPAQQPGQPPSRSWGFFLVQKQGEDPPVLITGSHNLIELFLYLESHHLI